MVPYSGWIFIACGLMLGYFAYTIHCSFQDNPTNKINYYYRQASIFICASFFCYGMPSIVFPRHEQVLTAGSVIGTLFAAIGFSSFLMIPLYSWIGPKRAPTLRYLITLYVVTTMAIYVIIPPETFVDTVGITHWGFSLASSLFMAALITAAFTSNIILLVSSFKMLSSLSALNTISLIFTFLLTLFGGGYQYLGNSTTLLALSSVSLFCGILFVFLSALKKSFLPRTRLT